MRSRQKILNATLGLIETGGFEGVNVAAVASAAGVSRQTVYSIFGSREEVVSQAMAGLAIEIFQGIEARLESACTACDYVVEAVVSGRSAVRTHPVLASLLVAEQGNPVFDFEMMARANPVARHLFEPMVERGLATRDELGDIVEIVVRLGLSIISFDSDAVRTDDALRAFLRKWLAPALPTNPTP
ncbi:TetR/AcrR family transcriptional regulator [Rhodococcus sp. G-MC3]|uniref:TetR/AcrR family transcriptional regulator n=1 Tax=Rhodococcus sp. G-MC3 TaxID=3046209 RepID=UPI0024B87CC0|nr:TetR/AcrR family transcriptional regulator [Rhodococcus sp. G-MC3]MDJ0392507.1 TetR/AcrR family transcriptional regulator [Rhodococcus sp. G-MC3]